MTSMPPVSAVPPVAHPPRSPNPRRQHRPQNAQGQPRQGAGAARADTEPRPATAALDAELRASVYLLFGAMAVVGGLTATVRMALGALAVVLGGAG
jgi:hypothetical protein